MTQLSHFCVFVHVSLFLFFFPFFFRGSNIGTIEVLHRTVVLSYIKKSEPNIFHTFSVVHIYILIVRVGGGGGGC